MKLRTRVVLQLAALFLALGASALADSNAYLYIVHAFRAATLPTISIPACRSMF
jgi:hypothetical protein